MRKKTILFSQLWVMLSGLLASASTTAAGPFTSSGAEGLQVLFFVLVVGEIFTLLLLGVLLYFAFAPKAVKFKKKSRIILASFFLLILMYLSSTYLTPYYPAPQNNTPAGKNYEEVTIFNNRIISRKNGEVVIVPHDYYYPEETQFSFSRNYKTNDKGEKIYQVNIAYTRNRFDFKREQPFKFAQISGTNQFKYSIPIFPVAVDKYKFINNKSAYLIVPNEPNTKQIFAENENAQRALKSIEKTLNRPDKSSYDEFSTALNLITTLDLNNQIPIEVFIENLGWRNRTDELIKRGVDVNGLWEIPGRSDWSYSPLMWSVRHDHIFGEVEYLMEHGADPHKKNSLGKSPYEELIKRLNTRNDIDESYKSMAERLVRLMDKQSSNH